jgi:hypothetical protein
MKTLILILTMFGLISVSHAQVQATDDVPIPVHKAFNKLNPKASNVEWGKNGEMFAATYWENGLERCVTYNSAGKLQQKEEQVSIGQLPTQTLKYINDFHQDGAVKKATKITRTGEKSVYLVTIKDMDLNFDANGNYMNPVSQK